MAKTAVITGASSGIGAATARLFANNGFYVVIGARRLDRLSALADEIGAKAMNLDVTDEKSVAAFCEQIPECHVLFNNAGGAFGLEPIAEATTDNWRRMYEANVLGSMFMTRALLPKLIASGDGMVIHMGSVSSFVTYEGSGGYAATKHAVHAVNDALRKELLGQPVRVCEIDPGLVNTEFATVRFEGDAAKADAVYEGMTPLVAEDVAECVVFMATRPSHVNIDRLVVTPRAQIAGGAVHRAN